MAGTTQSRLATYAGALRELTAVDETIEAEEGLCTFELPSVDDPYRVTRVAALDRLATQRAGAASAVAVAEDAVRVGLHAELRADFAGVGHPVPAMLESLQEAVEEGGIALARYSSEAPSDEAEVLATIRSGWIRQALLVDAICREEPERSELFDAARRQQITLLSEDAGANRFAERLRLEELAWLTDLDRLAAGSPLEPAPEVWIDELSGDEVIARIVAPAEVSARNGDGAVAQEPHRGADVKTPPPAALATRSPGSRRPVPVALTTGDERLALRLSRSAVIGAVALAVAVVLVVVGMVAHGDGGGGRAAVETIAGTAPATTSARVTTGTTTAPTLTTAAPASTVPASTAPASTAPDDAVADAVMALARACPTLRSGALAADIKPNTAGTGSANDPRTNQPSRYVEVGWRGDLGPIAQRPPYTVTALLYLPGETAATTGPAIDRAGTVQLWFSWDGTTRHKGIRTFDGSTWRMALDEDALTVAFPGTALTFFWTGLQPGWRYAMVVATATGCEAVSNQADGSPTPIT